ncbi:MAG: hypothetical protein M3044_03080 [Thermoproteota archaeon]|nr:hypothetical protein [Thermoproteota archaeon]
MKKQNKPKINEDRGVFIDEVQRWFLKRNKFWLVITFLVLVSIIILQLSFTFLTGINPHIRLAIYPILIPLLLLFVFSIFWRNTITAFLSLAGATCLFVGMYYAYASRYEIIQSMSSSLSHTAITTTHMQLPPLAAVAAFYFLMGLFSASLCVAVALRPSFFRAKGALTGLPYPVWSTNDDPIYMDANSNSVLSLIPVQSLLSFGERHLISKYKYIQAMIGGRIYFVSLDDWVPQSTTYIIREKGSGSLVGIPKVSDGFNVW